MLPGVADLNAFSEYACVLSQLFAFLSPCTQVPDCTVRRTGTIDSLDWLVVVVKASCCCYGHLMMDIIGIHNTKDGTSYIL